MLWITILLAAVSSPHVAGVDREVAISEACSIWFDDRETPDASVHIVGDDGVCFYGSITDVKTANFIEAIGTLDSVKPFVVVVRSGGGEVTAAMAMAEALVPRTTTVVVKSSCFSSCANYLFLAGDRRVIMPKSVLGYHGGLFAQTDEYWERTRAEFATKMSEEEVTLSMESSKAYLDDGLAQQSAFLESVEVDPNFFDWMQSFNTVSKQEQMAACPVDGASLYLPSEAFLTARGVVIHSNSGPKSDAELAQVLAERNATGLVCYWD